MYSQLILVLLFIHHCILFHTNNRKPTLAHPVCVSGRMLSQAGMARRHIKATRSANSWVSHIQNWREGVVPLFSSFERGYFLLLRTVYKVSTYTDSKLYSICFPTLPSTLYQLEVLLRSIQYFSIADRNRVKYLRLARGPSPTQAHLSV